MLLNTSFNENEPVVCKPEEALACFLRTKMDVLVLGNYVISRLAQFLTSRPPDLVEDSANFIDLFAEHVMISRNPL